MAKQYDAIIIGAGHNGLVTAALLARAGRQVLVLERRSQVGGVAVTEELIPGYRVNSVIDGMTWMPAKLMADLQLARHGLETIRSEAAAFTTTNDGRSLTLWRDPARTADSIRAHSANDAARWPDFAAKVTRLARVFEEAYTLTPPDIIEMNMMELMPFASIGLKLRQMSDRELFEFIRVLPMPVSDWLREWFESDLLKGLLAGAGVNGLFQGSYAAGTAFLFLHHHIGLNGAVRAYNQVKGGIGQLSEALAASAKAHGVEIRTSAEVAQVVLREGKASGVLLTGGEEIGARAVISNADPRATFLNMVDASYLDPVFLRRVRNIRMKGSRARVHLALKGLPKFAGLDGDTSVLQGLIAVSPNIKYLEWAFDDAKHGNLSKEPYVEAFIPSIADPSVAPAGKHLMSLSFQHAPYKLNGGWNKKANDALLKSALGALEGIAPGISKLVEKSVVLSPVDLETTYGLAEGNVNHGEMMLDQLFIMRPVAGWSQYVTPIDGLYLCGAGTHPGGGVAGASGMNASREVLKRLR
jgi:phytoene dehydrogenase-like protein